MAKRKASWSAALQSRFTAVDGLHLHDLSAGSGPPMVCVHGLALASRSFIPLVTALAPWFACHVVDLPGFGRSEKPPAALDVPGLALALGGWLRATESTEATLVGISAGCQIIVEAVATQDDLTGPVVLLSPTMDPRARSGLRQGLRWLRTGWHADIGQLPILVDDANRAGWGRVARTFRAFLDDPVEEKLEQVAQPALVVCGSRDPIVPRRWAGEAADRLPAGRLEIVNGGAHLLQFTHPESVGLIVREYLAEIGMTS